MSKKYSRVIGIDVSKETLEISDSQSKRTGQIENLPAVIQQSLLAKIKDKANTLVVCEATGGLEIDLVVTACMRKLVTILNLMLKRGTKWSKTKKGDGRETSPSPTCSIGA